jgi:hypothetical protein
MAIATSTETIKNPPTNGANATLSPVPTSVTAYPSRRRSRFQYPGDDRGGIIERETNVHKEVVRGAS